MFELKAVNPHPMAALDERTPNQIVESIAAQGRIVADALARLNRLLSAAG